MSQLGFQAPDQFGYDSAILTTNSGARQFVSRGGITFDPGIEMRHVEFDGKQSDIVGLHRITARRPTISGRFKDVSPQAIMEYETGSSSDGSTPTNLITPKTGREFMAEGEYLPDVELTINKSNGKLMVVKFAFAIVEPALKAAI